MNKEIFEIIENQILEPFVGDRKKFRNRSHLAEVAGISRSTLSRIVKRQRTPDFETLDKLDKVCGTNLRDTWYKKQFGPDAVVPPAGFEDIKFIPASKLCQRRAPVFTVEAGGFLFDSSPDDYPLGQSDRYEWTSSNDPNALFVEVEGESMSGAGIHEGDLLELEPNKEVKNGDIIVCRKNGAGVTVKKMIIKPDHIILQPMNPAYEPIMITKEESQECKFIKVSEVRRKL